MIVVHGFPPMPPLPSPSPFCVKLETFLRMAELPYEAKADYDPFRAPKGKAPWVTLEDGSTLSDSEHIVRTLLARPEVTLDDGLDDEARARAVAVRRIVENHLYFSMLYFRWVRDDGFAILRGAYFGGGGWFERTVVPPMARRTAVKQCWAEGTGRHSPEEVLDSAVEDIDALSVLLGERPYFLGDEPRSVDATAWGTLANLLYGPFPGGLQDAVKARPELVAYCDRIRDRYWSAAG